MSKRTTLGRMKLYLVRLGDPATSSSVDGVFARSYARSTVIELMRLVGVSEDPPEMVVSEFIKMVDRRSGLLFRVAYETAVDLYDQVFL